MFSKVPRAKKTTAISRAPELTPLLGVFGASGTEIFRGYYNLRDRMEYVLELQGSKAIETYNRMRKSDSQCQLALLAIETPIHGAEWKLEAPGGGEKGKKTTPQEQEATDEMNEWLFGETFEFYETLRQVFGMFWAGYSAFEKIWGVDENGLLVVQRLAPRLQDTIVEWTIDERGEIKSLRQVIFAGETRRDITIPGNKVVVFTNRREGDDYRGVSCLRSAYKHWFIKDFLHRLDSMRLERWSMGMPVISETSGTRSAGQKNAVIEAVKNARAHEQGYIYMPDGLKVELLDSSSAKTVDPLPSIKHHDAAILKAVMAQFLDLGQTETGSRAVGSVLQDTYQASLEYSANYIAGVLNRTIIKDVCAYNYGSTVRQPLLRPIGIKAEDLTNLATAYNSLGNSGLVRPGPKAEIYIRDKFGIPQEEEMTDAGSTQEQEVEEEQKTPPDGTPLPADGASEKQNLEEKLTQPKSKKKELSLYASAPYIEKDFEPAPTASQFWRPLRPEEECVALRAIAGTMDDGREQIVRATRAARQQVVKELMPQIRDAYNADDPMGISQIDYSDDLKASASEAIQKILEAIYQAGRQQVANELARQKGEVTLAAFTKTPKKTAKVSEWFKANAEQTTERWLDKTTDIGRAATLDAIRSGSFDAEAISEQLSSESENVVRKEGGQLVNESFNLGRDQQASDSADSIEYALYSAILDNNTCAPCEELDQRETRYVVDSPEYDQVSPPSVCEGGRLCRCIWVYVGKEQQFEKAPEDVQTEES